jgi:urease accessory protein
MILGGLLGYLGFPLPLVETGIGLSVVLMGLAIALGVRLPTVAAMALVGLFALFYGHAHGTEGIGLGVAFLPYATGFVVATASLHMAGIALGVGLDRLGPTPSNVVRRAAGVVGALSGVCILAGWLAT